MAEPAVPPTPAIPATPTVPATPQKEIALATAKVKTDSTPASEITARQADKKDIIAKSRTTISKPPSAPITTMPMEEETSDQMVAATDEEVIMTTGASDPESVKKMRIAKMAVIPTNDIIKGKVTDAGKGSAPLEGVTVSISSTQTTTTGSDGTFEIGNLPLADYTVTFTKDGYASIVKKVVMADFVDGIATTDVRMGGTEILRGLTIDDLKAAEKWYYNEYRGGRNAESYPHWDWACNYMCTMDFRGDWEEQNEGTTLRIRNSEDDRKNPADLEMFDSFVFGSKLITEDNYMMTLQIRTHSADEAAPAYYGVQVVDLAAADPKAEMVGDVRTYASENYTSVPVDLSKYIGKEVIIAIGTFRAQTGDYWKQLVLRRIAFAKEAIAQDISSFEYPNSFF